MSWRPVSRRRAVADAGRWMAAMVLSGALGGPLAAATTQPHAEVFVGAATALSGAEALAVQGVRITRYNVDEIARINALLSAGLPGDPQEAAGIAVQRIARRQAILKHRYARGAAALLHAARHRLSRFPAIVFDGQAVVYGVTDLRTAYRLYQRWQADRMEAPQP